jgi:hypothetical protein
MSAGTGLPAARRVCRHASELRGLAALEAENAQHWDADEIRLEDKLIERRLGEIGGGVRILARDRLKDIAHVGAAPAFVGNTRLPDGSLAVKWSCRMRRLVLSSVG